MSKKTLEEKFHEYDSKNEWPVLYNLIRTDSSKLHSKFQTKAARNPENVKLNRYRDVLPYDHSRVVLSNDRYINASHVRAIEACRKYILTQGPLPDTAEHFWEMVWQEKSKAVIMLNKVVEKNQVKCHQYFPSNENSENGRTQKSLSFGDFEIRLLKETETKHYCLRTLLLIHKKSNDEREIFHYQFNTWPDFGVPETTDDFLEFLYEVRKMGVLNIHKYGPPIIHCSAGIGRSGTFIIVDIVLVLAQKSKDHSQIDILSLVTKLREDRMGLIQTSDQLRFSWKAIVDALENKENKSWQGLLETTCCEDGEHNGTASPIVGSDRPSLNRLSANQTTDSGEENSSTDDENNDPSSSEPPRTSTSLSDRERGSKMNKNNNKEISSNFYDDVKSSVTSVSSTLSNGANPSHADGMDEDSVRLNYEARLRKRQQRAKEMQEKIDKIQAKLHQSDSSGWRKYKYWVMGGTAVALVGAFLVYYLYSKDWSLF